MDALEAVVRVLIEQAIRGIDPFDLDYSDLRHAQNLAEDLDILSIIGDDKADRAGQLAVAEADWEEEAETQKLREKIEDLYWEIVDERRKNDPWREEKLFYKEYLRLYDERDPKWMEMEDQTYTDPRLIEFFEKSGCRDLSQYYVERRTGDNASQ